MKTAVDTVLFTVLSSDGIKTGSLRLIAVKVYTLVSLNNTLVRLTDYHSALVSLNTTLVQLIAIWFDCRKKTLI